MNDNESVSGATMIETSARSRWSAVVFGVVVLSIACAGVAVRSAALWDVVFVGDDVRLQDNDPWYHLRRVHYQVRQFPDPLDVDPYSLHPRPQASVVAPLSDFLVSGITVAIFGRDATDEQVAAVCAVLPPLAAGLTVIAVYLLGVALYNRRTGLLAAVVVAICPSLFFLQSLMGAADHHVWEVLWSTGFLAAASHLVAPWQPRRDAQGLSWDKLNSRRWVIQVIAGCLLAFYLMTWIGGIYFLAITGAWFVARHVVAHLRGRNTDRLWLTFVGVAPVALVFILLLTRPYPMRRLQRYGLVAVGLLPIVLPLFSRLLLRLRLARFWIIPGLAAGCLIGGGLMYLVAPGVVGEGRTVVRLFAGNPKAETIGEVASIFRVAGLLSLGPVWGLFATGFPLACIGWLVCLVRAARHGREGDILLTVWSAITFASMAGQGRFAYYTSINVALLVAVLIDALFTAMRRGHSVSGRVPTLGSRIAQGALIAWALALVLVPGLIAVPGLMGHYDGPSQGWVDALSYLRRETPEPYGDAEAYFTSNEALHANTRSSARTRPYGVMSWWDYGYWITAIARRIPCANPTQAGAGPAARFFTEQNERDAVGILEELGARYVVIDWSMAAQPARPGEGPTSKFDAMALWADRPLETYYEPFLLLTDDGSYVSAYLFYPAYFESMSAQLFVFAGDAVRATRTLVVEYERTTDADGRPVKRATNLTAAEDYDSALAMLRQLPEGKAALVSDSPYLSCIPLPPLSHFERVFDSSSVFMATDGSMMPEVRAFAYRPDGAAVPD